MATHTDIVEYNQLFSKETEPESLTLDFSLEDEEITGRERDRYCRPQYNTTSTARETSVLCLIITPAG